jgi:hypothetical protein
MDRAVAVRVTQRRGDFAGDPQGVVERELALPVQPGAQRLALDVGHDVEQEPVRLARVVERQDVGMIEMGRELDLTEKALGPQRSGDLGIEDLDRDRAAVAQVLGRAGRRTRPGGCHVGPWWRSRAALLQFRPPGAASMAANRQARGTPRDEGSAHQHPHAKAG